MNITGLCRAELPFKALSLYDALTQRNALVESEGWPTLDIYARISINRDPKESEKTDTQIVDLLKGMAERKARLGGIFRDDNRSAWQRNGKRPGWDAVLSRVADGSADGVLVVHIDRFLRQPRQLEQLIDASDRGSTIASLYGDIDLGTSMGRFIARGMVNQAAMQSDETSRRQKSKQAHRREEGKGHGGPRGFGAPNNRTGAQTPEHVILTERRLIAEAVDAFLDGDATLAEIARRWTAAGFRKTGVNVRDVFLQPRIGGLLEIGPSQFIARTDVEPIVPADRWRVLHATLSARKRGRPAATGQSPVSGTLKCGVCGANMVRKSAARDRGPQYRCGARSGCAGTGILAAPVDELVRARVLAELFSPHYAAVIGEAAKRLDRARENVRLAEERLRAFATKAEEGGMVDVEYEARVPVLRRAVEDARASLYALELSAVPTDDLMDTGVGVQAVAELAAQWDDGDAGTRRTMTRRAFREITVARGRQPAAERLTFVGWQQ